MDFSSEAIEKKQTLETGIKNNLNGSVSVIHFVE